MQVQDFPKCCIYGLADPRVTDPVQRLRYIGQTREGRKRPLSHCRRRTALKNDRNISKADWVADLQEAGAKPDIVVLEVITAQSDLETLIAALNEAERRLIAQYRRLGAPLTNIQEGGTSGYVLSAEERNKISIAKSWVPRKKPDQSVDLVRFETSWTREKAWWLGVSFARISVRDEAARRTVSFRTESEELLTKWCTVLGLQASSRVFRASCWRWEYADVRLVRWLSEKYRFHTMWEKGLEWPSDLPEHLVSDFFRGIWDAKGYVGCSERPPRQPIMRTSVESAAWGLSIGEAFVRLVPAGVAKQTGDKSRNGLDTLHLSVNGAEAPSFLAELYKDAPEAACESSQQSRALAAIEAWNAAWGSCEVCGKTALAANRRCRSCRQSKWIGATCSACASGAKVYALGLCSPCYQSRR